MSEPSSKPKRAEFRHPVLEMMGISRLRVPSRNWLIFWSITGSLVSAYYWDRYERKKVRNYWVDLVAPIGAQPINPRDVARKVRVYMAPPPNDYIDSTQDEFRNFIKPVLTSAALDHEIILEERQGFIRSKVSEEIRELRRQIRDGKEEPAADNFWHRDLTGGTIIVGRGAYKEYMSGVQEGWLGPLERPAEVQAVLDKEKEDEALRLKERREERAKATDGESQLDYENEEDWERDRKATLSNRFPVVPAYMPLNELSEQELPAEFSKHLPEPISVFRLPNLLGILMTPVRIYRWLNQRKLAEEMGSQAAGVVFAHTRPYYAEDAQLAISDEEDWPNRFKKKGLDNNSEWMREFIVDPRIAKAMEVYKNAERTQAEDEAPQHDE